MVTLPVRAAIYLRISRDPSDTRKGVARQRKDCAEIAAELGWPVVDVYDENNVSATRAKTRPEYQRLIRDVREGTVTAVVFWEFDRFTRSVREADDLLDLATEYGLRAASTSGGEMDLLSPTGRRNVVVAGADARKETDQMGKRLRRAFDQKAAAGEPHGAVPYGWRREKEIGPSGAVVVSRDVLDPVQAQVITDAVAMLRSGISLRATVKALNDSGQHSPRLGKGADGERHPLPWSSTTLKQVLLRARNAGLRVSHGEVLEGVDGKWPAIISVDDYEWLLATLTDPARRSSRGGRPRRHLLTGIAACGRCESGRMVVNPGRVGKDGKHQPPAYVCAACTRVRRKQADVDAVVTAYMVALLSAPGALDDLVSGDPAEVQRAREAREGATSRMALAADEFAAGRWSADQVNRVNAVAGPQIEAADAVIAAHQPKALPLHVAGPHAREAWEAASLEQRRALIEALAVITILPSGPGRSFDPTLIRIEPA